MHVRTATRSAGEGGGWRSHMDLAHMEGALRLRVIDLAVLSLKVILWRLAG